MDTQKHTNMFLLLQTFTNYILYKIHKIHLFLLTSKYLTFSIAAQSLILRMSAEAFRMSFRKVRNKELITRHEKTLQKMQFSLYHSQWFSF